MTLRRRNQKKKERKKKRRRRRKNLARRFFFKLGQFEASFQVRSVEGVEKWEDKKWGNDRKVGGQKRFSFLPLVFG